MPTKTKNNYPTTPESGGQLLIFSAHDHGPMDKIYQEAKKELDARPIGETEPSLLRAAGDAALIASTNLVEVTE